MASNKPNSTALRKEYGKQIWEQQKEKKQKGESQKHPKRSQVMPLPASSSHADEADGLEDSSPGAVASKKPGMLKKFRKSVKKTFSGSNSKKKTSTSSEHSFDSLASPGVTPGDPSASVASSTSGSSAAMVSSSPGDDDGGSMRVLERWTEEGEEGEEGGTIGGGGRGGGGEGREWERDLTPETPPSQRKKSSYDKSMDDSMMSPTWATGEQLFFKEGHFSRTTPPTGTKLAVAPPTGAPPTGAPPTGAPPTGAPPTGAPPTGAPPTGAPPTGAPPTGAPPTHSNASPQMTPPIAHQQAATRSAEDLEKHCQKLEEKLQQYKEIAKGRENEIKVLKDDLAELKEKGPVGTDEEKQMLMNQLQTLQKQHAEDKLREEEAARDREEREAETRRIANEAHQVELQQMMMQKNEELANLSKQLRDQKKEKEAEHKRELNDVEQKLKAEYEKDLEQKVAAERERMQKDLEKAEKLMNEIEQNVDDERRRRTEEMEEELKAERERKMAEIQHELEAERQRLHKATEKEKEPLAQSGSPEEQTYQTLLKEKRAEMKQEWEEKLARAMRDHDTALREVKKAHEAEIQQKEQSFQESLDQQRQGQENTVELQRAHMEKEIRSAVEKKEKEFHDKLAEMKAEKEENERVLQDTIKKMEQGGADEAVLKERESEIECLNKLLAEKDVLIGQLEADLSSCRLPEGNEQVAKVSEADMPSSIAPIASCLAKYINHEPIAAELETPHPLAPNDVQDAFRVLAAGSAVSSPAKPHSYVFAIFPASNVSQSLLFDFTGHFRATFDPTKSLMPGMSSLVDRSPDSGEVCNDLDLGDPKISDEQVEEGEAKEWREQLETLQAKVEERDRKIDELTRAARQSAKASGKLKDMEVYLDRIVKLTEIVTGYEAQMKTAADHNSQKLLEAKKEVTMKNEVIKTLQQKVAALQKGSRNQEAEEEGVLNLTVQISALEAEKSELKDRVTQLEDKVRGRDEELLSLTMKVPPPPQSPGGEQLYSVSLKLEEVGRLLAEREKENANLKVQLETFEKVAGEGQMFREHSTAQSEVVLGLKKEKEALEDELEQLKQNVVKQSKGIHEMQHKTVHSSPQQAPVVSKVEQLQEALEKSESQLAEKLAQHERELQKKESDLKDIRKLKKEEEDGWKRERAVLSEQLERLRSEKEEENEQLQEAEKKVTEMTEEMQAMKQETTTMRGQLEAYKLQAEVYEEDFKREREDREKAAGKLQDEQTNKTNLHALRTQLDFVSNEKQGYKTSSEQLKREKAHLESRLADHQENLAAVEVAFQRLQDVSRDLTRKLQDVEYDLEEKTREAEALRNQLKNSGDFQKQMNDLLTENEKLNEEVRAKAQQVRQYKKLADSYKAQVGERQRGEEHATEIGREELLQMYETDKNQLETQLQGTRNMIAHHQAQIENLTKQNERLKEELRKITMENEDLRVQYDKLFLENGELKALTTQYNIPVMEAAKRRSPMQAVRGQHHEEQAGMLARSVADPVYAQGYQDPQPGFPHGGGGDGRMPPLAGYGYRNEPSAAAANVYHGGQGQDPSQYGHPNPPPPSVFHDGGGASNNNRRRMSPGVVAAEMPGPYHQHQHQNVGQQQKYSPKVQRRTGPQDHDQVRERGGSNVPYLQRDSASVVQASQRAAGDQYQYQQRYQAVDPQYPADGQYPTPAAAQYQMGGQQYQGQGPGQGGMQHHQQQAMGGPPPPPLPAPVPQQQQWGPGGGGGGGGGGGARAGHGGVARLPNVDPESSAESDLMRGIDTTIQDVAADVRYRVESRPSLGGQPDEDEGIPPDPNLECITCGKVFRKGEIQKYKRHVATCGGGGAR